MTGPDKSLVAAGQNFHDALDKSSAVVTLGKGMRMT